MTRVWAIFKREFEAYFNSLMAYFFLVVFLTIINMLYVWFSLYRSRTPEMGDYFYFAVVVFWLFIPAATMRMWSEEKKSGTLELLMTMPIRDGEAVIGKFLAAFAFLGIALLLSFATIPPFVAWLGEVDWGPIVGGYLGLLLLGGSFVAVGLAMSSMTENQFIAFLLTSIICIFLLGVGEIFGLAADSIAITGGMLFGLITPLAYYTVRLVMIGQERSRIEASIIALLVSVALVVAGIVFQVLTPPLWQQSLITYFDAGSHFSSIRRGVIDSRDIVYYLSLIGFFLFLNYRAVSSNRWKQ